MHRGDSRTLTRRGGRGLRLDVKTGEINAAGASSSSSSSSSDSDNEVGDVRGDDPQHVSPRTPAAAGGTSAFDMGGGVPYNPDTVIALSTGELSELIYSRAAGDHHHHHHAPGATSDGLAASGFGAAGTVAAGGHGARARIGFLRSLKGATVPAHVHTAFHRQLAAASVHHHGGDAIPQSQRRREELLLRPPVSFPLLVKSLAYKRPVKESEALRLLRCPPALEHASLTAFGHERVVVLFGGLKPAESSVQRLLKRRDAKSDALSGPSAAASESLTLAASAPSNDTWMYDLETQEWMLVPGTVAAATGTASDASQALRLVLTSSADHKVGGGSPQTANVAPPGGGGRLTPQQRALDARGAAVAAQAGAGLTASPSARAGHCAASYGDVPLTCRPMAEAVVDLWKDSSNGPDGGNAPPTSGTAALEMGDGRRPKLIIFGGASVVSGIFYNDVWEFDVRDRRWTRLHDGSDLKPRQGGPYPSSSSQTNGLAAAGSLDSSLRGSPAGTPTLKPLSTPSLVATAHGGGGGMAAGVASTNSGALSIGTRIIAANPPAPRWKAACGVLDRRFFIFGGEGSNFEVMGDLHVFDLAGRYWRAIRRPEPMPSPRYMHASCTVGDKLLIVGGVGPSGHEEPIADDTWILEMRTLLWRPLAGRATALLPKGGSSAPSSFNHRVRGSDSVAESSSVLSDAMVEAGAVDPFDAETHHVLALGRPSGAAPDASSSAHVEALAPRSPTSPSSREHVGFSPELSAVRATAGAFSPSESTTVMPLASPVQPGPPSSQRHNHAGSAHGVDDPSAGRGVRLVIEGHVLIPFDDMAVMHGGVLGPLRQSNTATFVLDIVRERWYQCKPRVANPDDPSNAGSYLRDSTTTNVMLRAWTGRDAPPLPAPRAYHAACAIQTHHPTLSMLPEMSLDSLHRRGLHFTDTKEMEQYVDAIAALTTAQESVRGVLYAHLGRPIVTHTVGCLVVGGVATDGATAAASGSGGAGGIVPGRVAGGTSQRNPPRYGSHFSRRLADGFSMHLHDALRTADGGIFGQHGAAVQRSASGTVDATTAPEPRKSPTRRPTAAATSNHSGEAIVAIPPVGIRRLGEV